MTSFPKVSTTARLGVVVTSLLLLLPRSAESFSQNHISFSSRHPISYFAASSSTSSDNGSPANNENGNPPVPPPTITLERLAHDLARSKFQKIVVLIGAGMSVSAGIPDFRTPGTGLYSKLDEYQLPYPEAIFELSYFQQNPAPFVDVARAIWPGQAEGPKPTLAHSFVALLEQRGMLKRVYTQNIDGLERLAGVSDEKLIECHGHFSTASCTKFMCRRKGDIDIEACRDLYMQGKAMNCPDCDSLVKPDIVFFGEELPSIFVDHINPDMDDCDLLIVMGTSLLVAPVASIPNWVGEKVPRVLINRDLVGSFATAARRAKQNPEFLSRDVFAQGDCDDGARIICELAGEDWITQLQTMHTTSSSE